MWAHPDHGPPLDPRPQPGYISEDSRSSEVTSCKSNLNLCRWQFLYRTSRLHEVSWFRHSLLADTAHSAVTVVSAYARFSNGLCHCCVTISRWQLLFLPPCPQRRERFHPVGKRPVERNRTHFVKVSVDPGITLLWLSRLKRAANPISLNKSCLRLLMLQFFRFFCAHSEFLSLSILDSSVVLNVFSVLV